MNVEKVSELRAGGTQDQSEGSKDVLSTPPLPTKLLGAKFLTSACKAVSGAHTADAAWDHMFPSVAEVENAETGGESSSTEDVFTVMLRNIPCRCSRQDFLDVFAAHGWGDSYDFFHLPIPKMHPKDFKGNLGYAFIGFPDPKLTRRFMQEMKGVRLPGHNSKKEVEFVPARLQGLQKSLVHLARGDVKKLAFKKTRVQGPQENSIQLAHKKIVPCKTSLQDTFPKQHSGKTASTGRQSRKSDSHQDVTMMPPDSWNQMNGFGSPDSMWNDSLQHWSGNRQQSYDIEEFGMQMASVGSHSANSDWMPKGQQNNAPNTDWYSSTPGFMAPYGTQASWEHSQWSLAVGGLEEDAASDADSGPDAPLEAACSASSPEPAGRAEEEMPEEILTVMMKNIPCRCSQQEVLDLLANHGWGNSYNFFNLPLPRHSCKRGWKGCLGYAFIGFPNSNLTKKFMQEMQGVGFPNRKSAKLLDITLARYQGLEENLAQLSGKKVNQPHPAPIYRKHAGPVQEMFAKLSF